MNEKNYLYYFPSQASCGLAPVTAAGRLKTHTKQLATQATDGVLIRRLQSCHITSTPSLFFIIRLNNMMNIEHIVWLVNSVPKRMHHQVLKLEYNQ